MTKSTESVVRKPRCHICKDTGRFRAYRARTDAFVSVIQPCFCRQPPPSEEPVDDRGVNKEVEEVT